MFFKKRKERKVLEFAENDPDYQFIIKKMGELSSEVGGFENLRCAKQNCQNPPAQIGRPIIDYLYNKMSNQDAKFIWYCAEHSADIEGKVNANTTENERYVLNMKMQAYLLAMKSLANENI